MQEGTRVRVPKCIDVDKLKNPELLVRVKERLDSVIFDGLWENYKEQVYSAGSDVLGLKKKKKKKKKKGGGVNTDWFDECSGNQ